MRIFTKNVSKNWNEIPSVQTPTSYRSQLRRVENVTSDSRTVGLQENTDTLVPDKARDCSLLDEARDRLQARDRLLDEARDRLLDEARGKLLDEARGKLLDEARGKLLDETINSPGKRFTPEAPNDTKDGVDSDIKKDSLNETANCLNLDERIHSPRLVTGDFRSPSKDRPLQPQHTPCHLMAVHAPCKLHGKPLAPHRASPARVIHPDLLLSSQQKSHLCGPPIETCSPEQKPRVPRRSPPVYSGPFQTRPFPLRPVAKAFNEDSCHPTQDADLPRVGFTSKPHDCQPTFVPPLPATLPLVQPNNSSLLVSSTPPTVPSLEKLTYLQSKRLQSKPDSKTFTSLSMPLDESLRSTQEEITRSSSPKNSDSPTSSDNPHRPTCSDIPRTSNRPTSLYSSTNPDNPTSLDSPSSPDSPFSPDSPSSPDSPFSPDSPSSPDRPSSPDGSTSPDMTTRPTNPENSTSKWDGSCSDEILEFFTDAVDNTQLYLEANQPLSPKLSDLGQWISCFYNCHQILFPAGRTRKY
jgi:hypothetical protein